MRRNEVASWALGLVCLASTQFASAAEEVIPPYRRVTWFVQCDADPIPVPSTSPGELVITGPGPHQFNRARLANAPLVVEGKVCPPARMSRDAVFVVDVSGSMSWNDPIVRDPANPALRTCGRHQALLAVLDRLPAGTTNFGIATFDADTQRASTRLFSDRVELENDITQSGRVTLVDAICAAGSTTSYSAGLRQAKRLLELGREDATKEIYFLSDGEPSDGSAARSSASDLKTNGVFINGQAKLVTIATVMLGTASDTILRNNIASLDTAGQPIHAVAANADDLAAILDSFADNDLEGARLTYGPTGSTSPVEVDVMPYLNSSFEFQLPEVRLTIDAAQTGQELNFEYWDTHANMLQVLGKIEWLD